MDQARKPVGWIVTPWWRIRWPHLVWASRSQVLHRVLVHGSGFSAQLVSGGPPALGFFAWRVVAASSGPEAEAKAFACVRSEWLRRFHRHSDRGDLQLEVKERSAIEGRFLFRVPQGFTFY
jgi:hypothetical protein